MAFSDNDRVKALLWCDRHCCLCGKQCGVFIVLHHIDPKATSDNDSLDNAIPLCFDCHGEVGHYNDSHPIGTKLKPEELIKRREQMYERYTSRFVPPVLFKLTQQGIVPTTPKLTEVGFSISHCASDNPVKAYVCVCYPDQSKHIDSEYYSGTRAWHLNPGTSINGHFSIERPEDGSKLTLRIDVVLEDCWQRRHDLLPLAYTFDPRIGDWYLEPSPPSCQIT